jgi:RNA polymerase sigma-70 factor (ECF subfamily)
MNTLTEKYTDAEVADRILNGETPLYEILIRRCNSFLYRIGRAYGFNHEDTEDLMQETYVAAYRNLSGFEGKAQFKTWASSIMRNNCYHKKQKFSYSKETPMEEILNANEEFMTNSSQHAEQGILQKELGMVMEKALSAIDEDYRLVFTLRELNGLSVAESAEVLSISEANVKVRLNRAKKMLRTEIEKIYTPEDIYEFNLIYCDRMVQRVMDEINKINTHE